MILSFWDKKSPLNIVISFRFFYQHIHLYDTLPFFNIKNKNRCLLTLCIRDYFKIKDHVRFQWIRSLKFLTLFKIESSKAKINPHYSIFQADFEKLFGMGHDDQNLKTIFDISDLYNFDHRVPTKISLKNAICGLFFTLKLAIFNNLSVIDRLLAFYTVFIVF